MNTYGLVHWEAKAGLKGWWADVRRCGGAAGSGGAHGPRLPRPGHHRGQLTHLTGTGTALQPKFHLCIPFLGIAWPQSQLPHSCVRIGPHTVKNAVELLGAFRPDVEKIQYHCWNLFVVLPCVFSSTLLTSKGIPCHCRKSSTVTRNSFILYFHCRKSSTVTRNSFILYFHCRKSSTVTMNVKGNPRRSIESVAQHMALPGWVEVVAQYMALPRGEECVCSPVYGTPKMCTNY